MKITTHVDINKNINMFIEKVNSVFEIYAYEDGINGSHTLIGTGKCDRSNLSQTINALNLL